MRDIEITEEQAAEWVDRNFTRNPDGSLTAPRSTPSATGGEPTTEAGQRDHDAAWSTDPTIAGTAAADHQWERVGCEGCAGIARIEAEARASSPPPLDVERLADLEHEQWAHWTRYMLDNLTPENIERWRRQIATAYADLTEREKESDREWARRAVARLSDPDTRTGEGA